jgi:site-specific recombinase XerD
MSRKKNQFYDLLEDYFNYFLPVAKGLSAATVVSYKTTFRLLMEYMYTVKDMSAEEISFESLTTECIQGFLDWLETDRKCSISTRNQRLSAIAAFARYAQGRNFGEASVFRNNVTLIPKKKAPKKEASSVNVGD